MPHVPHVLSPRRVLPLRALSLLVALTLGSCASAPWVCTPDTCLSVASAPLPADLTGRWESTAGERLSVTFFRRSDDDSVVQRAALLVFDDANAAWQAQQLASFDGVVVLAEQHLGEDSRAPRRFHRLVLDGDRLRLSSLPAVSLALAAGDDLVQVVSTPQGAAVTYTDLVAVSAVLARLLQDPIAWVDETVYRRLDGGAARALNARPGQPPARAGSAD